MNILQESNFFFFLLTLLTLLSITSSPLSLTSYLMAASDNGNGGADDNGNNGRANNDGDGGDDGGSDDGDGGDGGDDGGSDDGDGGDDGGSDDGDGGDDGGSENTVLTDTNNGKLNKNNELSFVSQTSNLSDQTSNLTDQTSNLTDQTSNLTDQDSYEGKAFYILIKSVNNKTDFVPDKVTLAEGAKVTWLNYDTSEHRITVDSGSKSGYPLLNSLILPNGMVDQEFQSVGTYHYSDLDSPQSKGVITILDNAQKEDATSIALEE